MLTTALLLTRATGADTATATAIATVISALIAGAVAYATQRTAAKASAESNNTVARTDLEKEAFERAESFYLHTIERQDREIHKLEEDVDGLKQKVHEQDLVIAGQAEELATLRNELEVAQKALRLRFPDEP